MSALRRLTFQNPWIAAVDNARRPGRSWVVLGVGLASCAAAILLGPALGGHLAEAISAKVAGPWAAMLGQLAFYLCVFLPLWLVAILGGVFEGRVVWRKEPRALAAIPAGLAIGALGFCLAVAVAAATGVVSSVPVPQAAVTGGLAIGALIVAFQAGGEEIFFRGWIQPVLCARFGPWVGLGVTAAMFMGLHLVGGVRSPLSALNLLLGGLLFGLLALRTGGLWAAFSTHWAWNWTESGGLGLDPNPGVAPTGALIDFDLSGPALWSGGGDGMNGSLAATLVLAAMVATAIAIAPRRTVA
jgi:membrane protease YdiL (CAAX protease family)